MKRPRKKRGGNLDGRERLLALYAEQAEAIEEYNQLNSKVAALRAERGRKGSRPGQMPPRRRQQEAGSGEPDEDDFGRGPDNGPDAGAPHPSGQTGNGGGLSWQERQERSHGAWAASEPRAASILLSGARLRACQHASLTLLLQQHMQERLGEAWRGHRCSQGGTACKGSLIGAGCALSLPAEQRDVEYVSLQSRFLLVRPTWHCSHCMQTFSALALHVGCWPSSQREPAFFYDLAVMDFYHQAQRGGLSITGRCWGQQG